MAILFGCTPVHSRTGVRTLLLLSEIPFPLQEVCVEPYFMLGGTCGDRTHFSCNASQSTSQISNQPGSTLSSLRTTPVYLSATRRIRRRMNQNKLRMTLSREGPVAGSPSSKRVSKLLESRLKFLPKRGFAIMVVFPITSRK